MNEYMNALVVKKVKLVTLTKQKTPQFLDWTITFSWTSYSFQNSKC